MLLAAKRILKDQSGNHGGISTSVFEVETTLVPCCATSMRREHQSNSLNSASTKCIQFLDQVMQDDPLSGVLPSRAHFCKVRDLKSTKAQMSALPQVPTHTADATWRIVESWWWGTMQWREGAGEAVEPLKEQVRP